MVFTFIESAVFERVRAVYLDDDEYSELQQFMMQNPEAGEWYLALAGCENCAGNARAWASVSAYA